MSHSQPMRSTSNSNVNANAIAKLLLVNATVIRLAICWASIRAVAMYVWHVGADCICINWIKGMQKCREHTVVECALLFTFQNLNLDMSQLASISCLLGVLGYRC